MYGLPIERLPAEKLRELNSWLVDSFGPASDETYYIDYDFDLHTLCMSKQVYTLYLLKYHGNYSNS